MLGLLYLNPLLRLGGLQNGVADVLGAQRVAEVRVGLRSLRIVEALEELGEGVGEGVLVTEAETRDPPVARVGVVAVGRVDAGPTSPIAGDGVVEVVETVEVVEVPLEGLMFAVDLEGVERLVAASVAGGFELRDRTVLEAAEENRGVVDGDGLLLARGGVDAFLDERLGHRGDLGDVTVDPASRVDAVRKQVARHAGTSGSGVEAPETRAALRQLGGDRPILEEVSTVVEHAAQFAGGHDVLRERHGREETVVIPDQVREAGLLDRGDHLFTLGAVEGEGLFAEDHLAVLDALQRDLGVRVVRGADVDGVDVGARDQLAPVGFVGGVAPLLGEVLDLGFVATADGLADDVVASGQLVLREEVTDLRVGVGVGATHEAVTDETDANGFRHSSRG